MILTITLNPLLENRLYFNSVKLGVSNRSGNQIFNAGGKGINVSRQLNYLGIQNIALTFLGGNNGKIFRKILTDEKINFFAVSTKAETRAASIIIENNNKRLTTFFEPNSKISEKEIDQFKEKLSKMIQNCSTVIFSGSSPSPEASEIFEYGITLANRLHKTSILDTYGNHLRSAINASPTILHNNVSEIKNSLSIEISTEKEKTKLLRSLYKKGVKLAFLTDGKNSAYASKYDFIYKIKQPVIKEIDSTGSGDAFISGIIYGLEKGIVFDEFVKIGAALGVANAAKSEVCNSTFDEIEEYKSGVAITSIGKKLKLIDDSPTH